MFNSPISKTQEQLVRAAREATSDYITNGTDLTEAVVKAASALSPVTSEHVRRICEMTYHDAYERMFAEKTGMLQYVSFDPPDAIRAAEMLDALQLGLNNQANFDKLANYTGSTMNKKASLAGMGIGALAGAGAGAASGGETTKDKIKRGLVGGALGAAAGKGIGSVMSGSKSLQKAKKAKDAASTASAAEPSSALVRQVKTASAPSMPRKFQRMNTHEIWTKAASGAELPDHNPTRSIQQVHRDLKDSISTVKSELYSAEHNEKLAMIDMVKQAKAGLSAGHSMEQVLHAALSVVDATEPLMAKTAHDLCATIVEACANHQNSGFRKEAQGFMEKAKNNSKGWKKNPMKLIYNFDHNKTASLQEVNPNHPIPQKFKKLAEANIQRKHLEVTLDELNRNLDYFNEKLVDELTR